jgi:hypothetical protein
MLQTVRAKLTRWIVSTVAHKLISILECDLIVVIEEERVDFSHPRELDMIKGGYRKEMFQIVDSQGPTQPVNTIDSRAVNVVT